ncbi:GNAT family N-acetyltransferase [Microbacterium sp.]|uniref:GNAT family N-acetyltransferase n=1 Tax=Microbacterium sp. TaxID=51671 RepID=UPI0025D0FCA2|nr:GNAT family N-acetyltransferase [Microbacterium sp.]
MHPIRRAPVTAASTADVAAEHPPPDTWSIVEVPWSDPRADDLRAAMDVEMSARYHDRLDAFDEDARLAAQEALTVDPADVLVTVLALDGQGAPVGHAALRDLAGEFEVKRVYVAPAARGRGASRALMSALEDIAIARGARRLILQTGDRQPDAVALYEHIGYTRIPVFAPYLPIDFSICLAKDLTRRTAGRTVIA